MLNYVTTNREGYREYKSRKEICSNCPLLKQCSNSKTKVRTLLRHVWEEYKEQVIEHRYEEQGKQIYERRKETVERSFADANNSTGIDMPNCEALPKSLNSACWPPHART